MNNTQLTCLLLLMSAVLICGCDVVAGKKSLAEREAFQHEAAALNTEIEMLKDQNIQLTNMLEESESKLATKASKLEQTGKQLQESLAANTALETRLSETDARLIKVGELADQIATSFKTNTTSLEKQIQSLGQMLPQSATASQAEHDPAAEQTAEISDEQGDHK